MNDEASLCFIAHATHDTRSVRAPILRATLMQRSAWKGYSRKSFCRILHSSAPMRSETVDWTAPQALESTLHLVVLDDYAASCVAKSSRIPIDFNHSGLILSRRR